VRVKIEYFVYEPNNKVQHSFVTGDLGSKVEVKFA